VTQPSEEPLLESDAPEGDDEAPLRLEFELQHDLDKRLDRYLVDRAPTLSRTQIQRLIEENAVTVNGRVAKASTRLRKGDRVIALLPPPPSEHVPADDISLDVLFEDDDLIVVNKQAGLIVHPARSHKRGTLVNALAWRFRHVTGGSLSTVGKEFARPGVVHRLDKWTTGVMVAAKGDTAHWRLAKQFEKRTTGKRYLAVVHGSPEPDTDRIDLPLGKHATIREMYAVRWDETGKPSQTIYRVRERYEGFALVELELLTGRTHQIRVHMSHLGWSLAGDDLYDGKHLRAADLGLPGDPERPVIERQALHASLLSFEHPITPRPMTFTAPLPADLRELVLALRAKGFRAVDAPGSTLDLAALGIPR
jgi:23S rRNA pseudouridine1911/1915/1917 synthase